VDIDTLQARVLGLLDQLGSIDEQIKVAELAQGLPARARLSDLNKQKATVLRTLAALEKARIAASN
jgi:flagellar biosynthesis/type III secretory pathway chaperone